jgi:nitrogen fixation protein NifB
MAKIVHITGVGPDVDSDVAPEDFQQETFSDCALGAEDPSGGTSMCTSHRMRALDSLPPFPDFEGKHPCFSVTDEGHARQGRLHLPVSPGCNLTCQFCKIDYSNRHEQRPGVSNRVLTPEEAIETVHRALTLCPAINVIGIAGPGDTLVTDYAVRTFKLVHEAYPHLINCVSTNGLLLPERAEQLVEAGVRTITVTVNSVDPETLVHICPSIIYDRRRLVGEDAVQLLIANQLLGIRRAVALGAVVKINTVLVPGINEEGVSEVAHATAEAGASLINVIPLIPQHELAGVPAPTLAQLERAREDASKYLTVFSHCQRCRADACGIPGVNEFASQLYDNDVRAATTFSHG